MCMTRVLLIQRLVFLHFANLTQLSFLAGLLVGGIARLLSPEKSFRYFLSTQHPQHMNDGLFTIST